MVPLKSRTINGKRAPEVLGFDLSRTQRAAVLSRWVYLAKHHDFEYSSIANESDSMSDGEKLTFPDGFKLWYLCQRDEHPVSVQWAVIADTFDKTLYLVFTGTNALVDAIIDFSFTPQPITIDPKKLMKQSPQKQNRRKEKKRREGEGKGKGEGEGEEAIVGVMVGTDGTTSNVVLNETEDDDVGVCTSSDCNNENENESENQSDGDGEKKKKKRDKNKKNRKEKKNKKNRKNKRKKNKTKRRTGLEDMEAILTHGGIGGNIIWLYNYISDVLDTILYQNGNNSIIFNEIVVCGHSLGGGYASVMGTQLLSKWDKIHHDDEQDQVQDQEQEQISQQNENENLFKSKLHMQVITFGAPLTLAAIDPHVQASMSQISQNTFNFVHRYENTVLLFHLIALQMFFCFFLCLDSI